MWFQINWKEAKSENRNQKFLVKLMAQATAVGALIPPGISHPEIARKTKCFWFSKLQNIGTGLKQFWDTEQNWLNEIQRTALTGVGVAFTPALRASFKLHFASSCAWSMGCLTGSGRSTFILASSSASSSAWPSSKLPGKTAGGAGGGGPPFDEAVDDSKSSSSDSSSDGGSSMWASGAASTTGGVSMRCFLQGCSPCQKTKLKSMFFFFWQIPCLLCLRIQSAFGPQWPGRTPLHFASETVLGSQTCTWGSQSSWRSCTHLWWHHT